MKKCCLNCAFCARYKDAPPVSLTDAERKQALSGNFDFVGKEQKALKEWQEQYKKNYEDLAQGKYHDQLGGPRVLEILTRANNPDDFTMMRFPDPIVQLFGMPDYPVAPYKDYLVCWHKLWNFENKENELSSLNKKNKCLFFYPYDRKGNKSFEGCEKEREALLAKSRFTATNWLVVLGIFVTILIFAIQTWNNRQVDFRPKLSKTKENHIQEQPFKIDKNTANTFPTKVESKGSKNGSN